MGGAQKTLPKTSRSLTFLPLDTWNCDPANPWLTWWQSSYSQVPVALKSAGIQNHCRPLPDIILWLQWILWHSLSRPCHRLLLQHYEILPACLGLPFKDLSDSKSGWEQQDELGRLFWGGTAFLLNCLALLWDHLMRFLLTGRDSVCRLTQPCSLSCRNAETSFSDWLNQELRGIHFFTVPQIFALESHLNATTHEVPHVRAKPTCLPRGWSQVETTYRVHDDFSIPRWVHLFLKYQGMFFNYWGFLLIIFLYNTPAPS